MIKILHISDFHYKKDHSNDYEDIVRKMCDSLQKQSIDIIVFSGDLVFEASNADILNNASDVLFTPLIKTLNLDNKRVIITPGNHDLKRGEEMPMVRNQLDSISTIKELDTFCQDQKQCKCSLDNFKNYNSFITTFYGSNNNSLLYYTDVINLHDTTIGVVSFNSAWRCTDSVKDRGNLLYPVYLVKEALSKVQKCDLIICNQHHNISDYRDYVAQDIEDEINEKCHILFTGHYHKASINTNHDAEVGLLHISAFASMNRWDKESKYGYSIIEIDESFFEISVKELEESPLKEHEHTFFELVYILSGTGLQCINNNKFDYHEGHMFLITPQDCHSFDIHTTTKFFFIRFNDIYIYIFILVSLELKILRT